MVNDIFGYLALLCAAYVTRILVTKIKLPAILGWLIAGIVFGPYLGGLVSTDFLANDGYKIYVHVFECFAGVMIGSEINLKDIKKTGSKIIITTLFQSLGTFIVVSCFFLGFLALLHKPLYLAFIFGGIALATAPAPALSIVKQYRTDGPVTRTLIPMAALDDIVGVIVFFSVISIVNGALGGSSTPAWMVMLMVLLPFAIGLSISFLYCLIQKFFKSDLLSAIFFIFSLLICTMVGVVVDHYLFGGSSLNYLLIGMAFSLLATNMVEEKRFKEITRYFSPILSLSLVIVIVGLGMPLDYKAMAGAGLLTAVYIVSRAVGKIGGAYLGARITKCDKNVQKYLGLTLLPHSGVSLVFTGIAISSLSTLDPDSVPIIQGTIVAAAIINEIIAVILAKVAFTKAGEIGMGDKEKEEPSSSAEKAPMHCK